MSISRWGYREDPNLIQKWLVDGKEVSFYAFPRINQEPRFWYRVLNCQTRQSTGRDFDRVGRSVEDTTERIKACFVQMDAEGRPVFAPLCDSTNQLLSPERVSTLNKWPARIPVRGTRVPFQMEVTLLAKEDGNLVWRLFDKKTKTASLINTLPFDDFAPPNVEVTTYYRPCKATIETDRHDALLSVVIQRFYRSELDRTKVLDRDTWAVTLICAGSSSSADYNCLDNCKHAMIVYEGVGENRIQFKKAAHLTQRGAERGFARSAIIDNNVPPYHLKTPTWTRTREAVERMLQNVGDAHQRRIPFDINGEQHIVYAYQAIVESLYCWRNGVINGDSFLDIPQEATNEVRRFFLGMSFKNCLTWDICKLDRAGIRLPLILGALASPEEYIRSMDVNNIVLLD
ncbi:MAG: hypothetical protein K940chlam6_00469 [Chlamydiae bacterium]|nr:hypothetical protein [Chlamydiota bacterium]